MILESYSGATRIIPLLGHPVAQTKSPHGMTLALARRGVDAVVVPLDVPPAKVEALLAALDGIGNLGGVMATVPHKFALCAHADIATPRAAFFGSANVMRRMADGLWEADMLDGLGLVRAVRHHGGIIENRPALLVGAGGAGGAIAFELLNAGAAAVAVHDTDHDRRDRLIAKLNEAHPGKARIGSASPAGYGVVINATPLGMRPDDPPPIVLAELRDTTFVGDVVTIAGETPLLKAAGSIGCARCSGHDMWDQTLDLMLDFYVGGAEPVCVQKCPAPDM
jgi:shikimate dehydrogenase